MTKDLKDLKAFQAEVSAWMKENKPDDPGFLLPQTFMEVGSEEQLNLLRELECDEAQGYHFGMPMAVIEVEEWLEKQSR